jgi:antirestriction protein ArdC
MYYGRNICQAGGRLNFWGGTRFDPSGRFDTKSYAAEELVAEMTAAFLCAHLDIKGELRHAGYIKNWFELLKEDSRTNFAAASLASKAADCLRAFSEMEIA